MYTIIKSVVTRRNFRSQNGQKCVGGGLRSSAEERYSRLPSWTKGKEREGERDVKEIEDGQRMEWANRTSGIPEYVHGRRHGF